MNFFRKVEKIREIKFEDQEKISVTGKQVSYFISQFGNRYTKLLLRGNIIIDTISNAYIQVHYMYDDNDNKYNLFLHYFDDDTEEVVSSFKINRNGISEPVSI